MTEDADILWNLYHEHCVWERHHEEQRASLTNILLPLAGGILSVIIVTDGINRSDLPLTVFLAMQGVFGAVFVSKQYERFARHQRLAGKYRKALDEQFPQNRIINLREMAEHEHVTEYPVLSKPRLRQLWVGLHMLIALVGAALTGTIFI